MIGCCFGGATLIGCCFGGSTLIGCCLVGSVFAGASFGFSVFTGSTFSGFGAVISGLTPVGAFFPEPAMGAVFFLPVCAGDIPTFGAEGLSAPPDGFPMPVGMLTMSPTFN
ncbi:pentapeptide repeat-containing protein [Paenibacillus barengoltzii]|uniref:pentapeptide repeat-containing protein n=1 Tax=Paenibacillus barengoltzii TaxID=343517 RepID=UPI003A4E31DA